MYDERKKEKEGEVIGREKVRGVGERHDDGKETETEKDRYR